MAKELIRRNMQRIAGTLLVVATVLTIIGVLGLFIDTDWPPYLLIPAALAAVLSIILDKPIRKTNSGQLDEFEDDQELEEELDINSL